ncbi:MAG: hypothetical protein V4525_03325 [Pseudomonadota bacterium]
MWKTILILGIFWLLWRRWVHFWRSSIARININEAGTPHSAGAWAKPQPASPERAENNRVVRCEQCGVYVPANEVNIIAPLPGSSIPRYCCIAPCEPEVKS